MYSAPRNAPVMIVRRAAHKLGDAADPHETGHLITPDVAPASRRIDFIEAISTPSDEE